MFHLFDEPEGERLPLRVEPRLESWDAADHPHQAALGTFLDHVEEVAGPALDGVSDSVAVRLSVGLPTGTPRTSAGRDLDNYLCPVIRRLGPERVSAAFAQKRHGSSTISLGPAVRRTVDDVVGFRHFAVTTAASAESRRWKEEIAAAVPQEQNRTSTCAIEIHLAFVISAGRTWTNLWKPAIDALGGILGLENPSRPFEPRDDRIVRLGLHRALDERVGWGVRVGVWWREIDGYV